MMLAVIADRFDRPSELWMRRQLALMEDHVGVCVARHGSDGGQVGACALRSLWPDSGLHRDPLGRLLSGGRSQAERRLRSFLRQYDCNRVLIHFAHVAVALAPWIPRRFDPLLVHVHGADTTWDLRDHESGERRHDADYVDLVRRLADRAVFISNGAECHRRLIEIGVDADRIALNHLSAPVSAVASQPSGRPRLLFLGRLFDCKGPLETIAAFDRALDLGLDAELDLAGDGPLLSQVQQAAAASKYADRMHVLGAVDGETGNRLRRQATLFTAHHCLGRRSRQREAFGVALLEAMAMGLPVITGRCGGPQEIIRDGVDGILFEPGDIEAHARALLSLCGDAARLGTMSASVRDRVAAAFAPADERRRLLELLTSTTA